jgi:hypothetical protein
MQPATSGSGREETRSVRMETRSGRDETGGGWKGRIADARDGRQARHIAGQTKVAHAVRGVHLNKKRKLAIG